MPRTHGKHRENIQYLEKYWTHFDEIRYRYAEKHYKSYGIIKSEEKWANFPKNKLAKNPHFTDFFMAKIYVCETFQELRKV